MKIFCVSLGCDKNLVDTDDVGPVKQGRIYLYRR